MPVVFIFSKELCQTSSSFSSAPVAASAPVMDMSSSATAKIRVKDNFRFIFVFLPYTMLSSISRCRRSVTHRAERPSSRWVRMGLSFILFPPFQFRAKQGMGLLQTPVKGGAAHA